MTVLLVDGDVDAVKKNSDYLESKGYRVLKAPDGSEALLLSVLSDFAVIDVELPDMDGYEIAEAIKMRNPVPVLFLTDPGSYENMERAFKLDGDYVKKPYSPNELCLRIVTMLQKVAIENDGIIRMPPLLIDTRHLSVRIRGSELFLTPREYLMLVTLCRSPNRPLSHEALFRNLWGNGEVSPHLVQQNISTLRRKFEKAAPDIRFITTIHGFGYMFRFPPEQV